MLTTTLDHRQFQLLGRLLVIKKPDVARELFEFIPKQIEAIEHDLTKIPAYFISFCQLNNIEPKDYIGPLYKSSKIDKRRFFIAAIILLYNPQTRLLQKHISDALQQDQSATGRMIKEVEFRYKNLADFKCEVDEIVEKIKN